MPGQRLHWHRYAGRDFRQRQWIRRKAARRGRRSTADNDPSGSHLQRVRSEETLTVESCHQCGADLAQVAASQRERRVLYDITFQVSEQRVEAEVKHCPACQARNKAKSPAHLPGPRQCGRGLQALLCNLLVAHMLSLRRSVALVRAISGLRLSEATCLACLQRLYDALQAWQSAARTRLLAAPALPADATGLRVAGHNH